MQRVAYFYAQFTGCAQTVQRSYWPENAIDWLGYGNNIASGLKTNSKTKIISSFIKSYHKVVSLGSEVSIRR